MELLTNINNFINKTAPRYAGFCHHRLATTNAHTHAYCYPLFESETKSDL